MKASTTTNTVRCDESQSKHRAKATEDTAQNVLSVELGDVSRAVAVNLPSTSTTRRNIRNAKEYRNVPENPLNRVAVPFIPKECQLTDNGEQFLVFDSGVNNNEGILL